MNKKTTISNLRVKLHRLTQLERSATYEFNTLNEYSNFLNETIQRMNLSVSVCKLLNPGQSGVSSKPSKSEQAKINELINRYSEALTEFSPKNDEPIINQFKKTSDRFKLVILGINLALITGSGILFYNIGKDVGNYSEENITKQLNLKDEKINTINDSLDKYKSKVVELSDLINRKVISDTTKVSN